jgi:hypothetical protein
MDYISILGILLACTVRACEYPIRLDNQSANECFPNIFFRCVTGMAVRVHEPTDLVKTFSTLVKSQSRAR